jgi:phage internal scaffolding protein
MEQISIKRWNEMKPIKVRQPYSYDTDAASNESGLHCEDATLTQQHFAEETDINYILKQFNITGLLPTNPISPRYGDFSNVHDYHSALNAVMAAEDEFDALPAQIRARFDNEPANLIDFLSNEQNRDEAEKLGLVNPSFSQEKAESTVTPLDVTVLGDTSTPN